MTKSASRLRQLATIQVGVHEAKTRLSELLRAVDSGTEVEILRNGDPVARLVPAVPRSFRQFGYDSGAFTVPDDFDAPLPEDLLNTFEGEGATDESRPAH